MGHNLNFAKVGEMKGLVMISVIVECDVSRV